MRKVLLAAGILGLVVTIWLLGKVQEWRRSDETECMMRDLGERTRDCTLTSYGSVILVAVISVLLIIGGVWAGRRHSSAGS
ncbi:MAG TPA: hypothetical protein VGK49_04485 [Ilumatobacteraceae bacterium]